MKVLNFGSLNIDHVYAVDHFVRPGETLPSASYTSFAGGKGLNQSVALARAGCSVCHAGNIGTDGSMLAVYLVASGVDASLVQTVDVPTGHALIQVDSDGENAIILFGGANQHVQTSDIDRVLDAADADDVLLLQNEIGAVPEIIRAAAARKLRIVFNPAPMRPEVPDYPLEHVELFICNETEAAVLTGKQELDQQCAAFRQRYPTASFLLTLGSGGAMFLSPEVALRVAACKVAAADTTAAGDTFIGYFLAEWLEHGNPQQAMEYAVKAAALCVTLPGAAESIPSRRDVDAFNSSL